MFLSTTPDDYYFSSQWHLNNTGQTPPGGTSDKDIDAPEGWDFAPTPIGSGVVVAVVDSGVDLGPTPTAGSGWAHPDLRDRLWINPQETPFNSSDDDDNGKTDDQMGWDFGDDDCWPHDSDGHGTACAGLVAADSNNSIGVAGVSWNTKIMAVKILQDGSGIVPKPTIAIAIDYAVENGADVISCSWGGGSGDADLTDAIRNARNEGRNGKGCVVVFASGNNGPGNVLYPANLKEVISVAAVSEDGLAYDWNNDGWELDVVAPSGNPSTGDEAEGNICTTDIRGGAGLNDQMDQDDDDLEDSDYTIRMGGTSASCPQVAGLAALLLSQNPELTAAQVQSLIMATADDGGGSGYDGDYGWGRINVYRALATATALATPGPSRFLLHDSEGKRVAGIDE